MSVISRIIKLSLVSTAVLVGALGCLQIRAQTQKSILWGDLDPGQHAVGFKVIYKYDHARSWHPRESRPSAAAVNSRPVRISVWYPARGKGMGRRVTFGDYIFYRNTEIEFARANKMIEERDVASFRRILRNSQTVFDQLMATPMGASRDVAAASGRFPLVIYSSGLNDVSSSNVVLYEYLASHGYVVVTVPQLGTTSETVNLGTNAVDVETQVRDLEFALGEMHSFLAADTERVAVAGHSMGGIAALLLQFRNANVDAVIGLDASYGSRSLATLLTASPYYRPEQMRLPFMDMRRPSGDVDLSSVNAFRYSNRYLLSFPEIYHGDFTSFPMIALQFYTDIEDRTSSQAARGYHLVCRFTLLFLNARLKHDAESMRVLDSGPTRTSVPAAVMRYEFRKGLEPPPTAREFAALIGEQGLQRAIDLYRKFKGQEPDQPIIDEDILNTLGYGLIGRGHLSAAIDVFHLNTEAHPTSANAYDSLADAFVRNGNEAEAIKQYEKVLQLLPKDTSLNESQKANLRNTAVEQLKRLRR